MSAVTVLLERVPRSTEKSDRLQVLAAPPAERAAGTKNTALFDIVRFERCTPRPAVRIARARARVPAERAPASEEPGPRGYAAKSMDS